MIASAWLAVAAVWAQLRDARCRTLALAADLEASAGAINIVGRLATRPRPRCPPDVPR